MIPAALVAASAIGAAVMAASWHSRASLGPAVACVAGGCGFYTFALPLVILLLRTLPHG